MYCTISMFIKHYLVFIVAVKYVRSSKEYNQDNVYLQSTYLSSYHTFASVELFHHEVRENTEILSWIFTITASDMKCPLPNATFQYQHGGFPIVIENNKTFISDSFRLSRTAAKIIDVTSNLTVIVQETSPLAGNWFAIAYLNTRNDQSTVKKYGQLDCKYAFQMNVSVKSRMAANDILTGNTYSVVLKNHWSNFSFSIDEDIWGYSIEVTNCTSNGSLLCPLTIIGKRGGFPSTDSVNVNCADVSASKIDVCILELYSPRVDQKQYFILEKNSSSDVSVQLLVNLFKYGDSTLDRHNTTIFHNHQIYRNDVIKYGESNETVQVDDHTVLDENRVGNYLQTQHNSYLRGMRIPFLDRVENPNDRFSVIYSVSPVSSGNILKLEALEVVGFVVKPFKDQGGTLSLVVRIEDFQNSTVHGCITSNHLPVNGTELQCKSEDHFVLTSTNNTTLLFFPYPESGFWYLALQPNCDQDPCPALAVEFELRSESCLYGRCGEFGSCQDYFANVIMFSSCSCSSSYRGYTCEDDSLVPSDRQMMVDTLFLTLSNLMFIPAMSVAIYRRYYTEALVYFSNMFFSSFYHACDMGPWSVYRLCIMPYKVLSYCDFFLSIMSIWVTLIALAELPGPLYSFCHMVGAIALAMAVEWKEHGLWHNVVPIAVGIIITGFSWSCRCRRQRSCYPTRKHWLCLLPGLILAAFGLSVFAFVETDTNYPYTHSTWHMVMAASIIFLLPKSKRKPCTTNCKDSESHCDQELETHSESVTLIPAARIL